MLGFSLVAGGSAGVVACGSHTSTAQNEANKANGKTVGLNDTKTITYENKTASQDAYGIKAALYESKILKWDEVNELSFPDNKTPLKVGNNKVAYNIKAKDGSTANGSLNVNIQATPGPKPKPGPKVTPGEAVLTPATPPKTSKAQAEANKVNGKTVDLKDFGILGHQVVSYENKTAAQDAWIIKGDLIKANVISATEANDLTFDNTTKLKVGDNTVNYNVKASDGSTAQGSMDINIANGASAVNKKANGKTVDLKDTGILGHPIFNYENKTAAQDAYGIKAALYESKILNWDEVNELSFPDNKTPLKVGMNKVAYNVKASDGSTASGTINVNIENDATAVNNKLNGKTVDLKDTGILGYKIFNYENKTASQDAYGIKAALYESKILNWDEVNELSFPDNKTPLKVGENKVAYNIKAKDGSTASGTINVNIENDATAVNNKVNGKTVDVKDLKLFGLFNIYSFENKTAAQDSWIIKADLYKSKILNWNEVNDLTFADNKTKLQKGDNTVAYNVKAPDGSIANGTIDVNIS